MLYIIAIIVPITLLVTVVVIALSLCMNTKDNAEESATEKKVSVENDSGWALRHVPYRYRFTEFEGLWERDDCPMVGELYDEFLDW